ncbi:MAG: isoprenylcysteine carboxylmethyltransferase family protein [Bacteroidales bacterium]
MKTNLFIKQAFGMLVFFSAIFISAGSFYYWQGLAYAGIGLLMLILNYTVFKLDEELFKERSKPGEGVKKWDKTILGLSFLATIAMFIIAGLDSGRYHWSPEFPVALNLLGILLTMAGQLIFMVAQQQNKFFSSTVRIQTDRGHTVCETGLYKIVRHPAYLGSTIQLIGFPLLFGSMWSIIPVFLSLILSIIRIQLEDNTLIQELNGYSEYAQKTKFKLIPYFW